MVVSDKWYCIPVQHRDSNTNPSFLPSFLPYFLPSVLPSFLLSFLPSFLPSFPSVLPSLPSFLSVLPSFHPSVLPPSLPPSLSSFLPNYLLINIFMISHIYYVLLHSVSNWNPRSRPHCHRLLVCHRAVSETSDFTEDRNAQNGNVASNTCSVYLSVSVALPSFPSLTTSLQLKKKLMRPLHWLLPFSFEWYQGSV